MFVNGAHTSMVALMYVFIRQWYTNFSCDTQLCTTVAHFLLADAVSQADFDLGQLGTFFKVRRDVGQYVANVTL